MSFNLSYPHHSHGIGVLAAIDQSLVRTLNSPQTKLKFKQTQSLRRKNRRQPTKRNSRLSNKNKSVIWSEVHRRTKINSQIEQLQSLYRCRNRDEVVNFIEENPTLVQLLRDAYYKIQEYFGSGVEAILEIFTDYEVPTHRELVALVQTRYPVGEALDRLDRLYEEWWAEASSVEPLKMSIDVENI